MLDAYSIHSTKENVENSMERRLELREKATQNERREREKGILLNW